MSHMQWCVCLSKKFPRNAFVAGEVGLKEKHFLGEGGMVDFCINDLILASVGLKNLSESIGPREGGF